MYEKVTLQNGLRLVTASMPHTRSVAIAFYIGVGSRYESEDEAGILHFIEHMCFKGTALRTTSSEISAAIEGVGGMLNGGTAKEMSLYWCKVAHPHFRVAMDVLADMLLNSRFDAGDIEKERQVIMEEIRTTKDTPSQEVGVLIDEILWPAHPLGRDTAGTIESVSSFSRESLLKCMNSRYLPSNTVVAIAGSVDHGTALDTVSGALGAWDNRGPAPAYVPYVEGQNPRVRVERRDTEQAHFCLAVPGPSMLDPKRFAHDLTSVILGEGMSSRLFTEIRDNLGLAYSIFSYAEHFLDSGALTVCASVEPRKLTTTVEAVLEQLARLKEETVPEGEIAKAKELSKGRMLLRMEDSRNVNGWIGAQEVLTGKIMTVDEVMEKIDAVSAEDIQELARETLASDRLRLAVVGPVPAEESLDQLLRL